MVFDLYVKNGQVVTDSEVFHGGLLINGGKIVGVVSGYPEIEAVETFNADGNTIFPGIVDAHVHINEPGREYWEDHYTGTRSGIPGGITTSLIMPLNATPPTIDRKNLDVKMAIARPKIVADVAYWGGLVNNNLDELADLHDGGVIGYKAFASNSATDFERVDDDILFGGLRTSAALGNVISLHAENEYLTKFLTAEMKAAQRIDRRAWIDSRPPFTEFEAVNRACYLAQVSGGHLHICHVSIAEGVEQITHYKDCGADITMESCPHYFILNEEDFIRIGPSAKCAPPLRSLENTEKMWELLKSGQIDVIASDHSPCCWSDKEKGLDNIWQAWGGINGNEATLPIMLTSGYHQRNVPLPLLAHVLSVNPAKRFGIAERKGGLRLNVDADFSILDLNKKWTFKAQNMFCKNKHSVYDGFEFTGKVLQTYIRGIKTYDQHEVLSQPGFGEILTRRN